jgi:hypothetical protein
MSWSISFKDVKTAEDMATEKAEHKALGFPVLKQVEEQLDAARVVALTLMESGTVGKDKTFRVALSGHANPDHEPASGWANDCITVNVYQQ